MNEKKNSLNEAFRKAIDYHTKGKIAEAKIVYEKILEIKPDHFLALGNLSNKVIRGTNPNEYDAMSQEDLSRVKVLTSKKTLIWEMNDDSTVEKVRKITKTGSISHASQLSEQLSKHPLASKL